MNNNTIKLQAFMAHAGVASRRASEKLIEEGSIVVNNKMAHIGQRINPSKDIVKYSRHSHKNGEIIGSQERLRYFIVDKPVGYVSTTNDEMGRNNVISLLPENVKERLYPVGRLDIESEGLILLTNDGALAQKLTHPSYKIKKTYHAVVKGTPTYKAINHLRSGVKLKDGFTRRAQVAILLKEEGETTLEISIHEGRNRQIRRMLERIGYDTLQLTRIAMGPLDLDILEGKTIVELNEDEIRELRNI